MGLTIYYSGRFKECKKLKNMIKEVEDVAVINKWDYQIFKDEFEGDNFEKHSINENLYGIIFSPPGCEPIQLTFTSNGRLCSFLELDSNFKKQKTNKIFYTIFSKTQYAGVEVHKIIIDLFRYLSGKFFSEFKLIDESNYWETNDENVLRDNFRKWDNMINDFAKVLEEIPINKNESKQAFVNRLSKHFHAKRKR